MFLLYTENGARYGMAPNEVALEAAGYRHGVAGTHYQNIILVTFEDGVAVCQDHCENQGKILADAAEWYAELQAA